MKAFNAGREYQEFLRKMALGHREFRCRPSNEARPFVRAYLTNRGIPFCERGADIVVLTERN